MSSIDTIRKFVESHGFVLIADINISWDKRGVSILCNERRGKLSYYAINKKISLRQFVHSLPEDAKVANTFRKPP